MGQGRDLGGKTAKHLEMSGINRTCTGFVCGVSNAALSDRFVLPYEETFILVRD